MIDELDYEMQQNYHLRLRATDTLTGWYSETEVNVILSDVNDNAPVFEKNNYIIEVSESALVDTSIGSVTAHDADAGANKLVHYHVESHEKDPAASDMFHIDSSTGNTFCLYIQWILL